MDTNEDQPNERLEAALPIVVGGEGSQPKDDVEGEVRVTRVDLQPTPRRVIVLRPPRGWLHIVLVAAGAAALNWALPVAVTLIAFLLTANNPWVMKANWDDALGVGASIWAIGHGAPLHLAAPVTLMPLGLTVLYLLVVRSAVRFARSHSAAGATLTIPVYALASLILGWASRPHAVVWQVGLGALILAAVGWLLVYLRHFLDRPVRWRFYLPALRGVRDGLWGVLALAAVSLVVGAYALYQGWERVAGINELLVQGVSDNLFVWIAQLAFLPNLLAWILSWLAGPGFYVGTDALYTPGHAPHSNLIPAFPVLGALPTSPIVIAVVLIPVLVGILIGAALIVWRREESLLDQLAHAATVAATMALVVTACLWLSTGEIGPDRMTLLGPRWALAGALLTVETALVAGLLYALSHPVLLGKYRRAAVAAKDRAHEGASEVKTRFDERRAARRDREDSLAEDEAGEFSTGESDRDQQGDAPLESGDAPRGESPSESAPSTD